MRLLEHRKRQVKRLTVRKVSLLSAGPEAVDASPCRRSHESTLIRLAIPVRVQVVRVQIIVRKGPFERLATVVNDAG